MRIGSELNSLSRKWFGKFFIYSLGTLDYHSHFRLKTVHKYIKRNFTRISNLNIIEFGCGNGINAFEIGKHLKNEFSYIGIDNDINSINQAKIIYKSKLRNYSCEFSHQDINKTINLVIKDYSVLLLIDVLEHLKEPQKLLMSISENLKKEVIVLVSVPTKNYIKYFGSSFNNKVGHVHEGYTLYELIKLFEKVSGELLYHEFNTGFIPSIGCSLFYKSCYENRYFQYIKNILLLPLRRLDYINNEQVSCSLFAVFKLRN